MGKENLFFQELKYFFPVVCVSHRVKRLTLLITGLGLLSVVALHGLPAPTWLHSRTFHSVPLNCWVGMNYNTCIDEGTWKWLAQDTEKLFKPVVIIGYLKSKLEATIKCGTLCVHWGLSVSTNSLQIRKQVAIKWTCNFFFFTRLNKGCGGLHGLSSGDAFNGFCNVRKTGN